MSAYSEMVSALLRELEGSLRSVNEDELNALRGAILQARRIFLAGRGRSGLQMRAFAMRLMHLGLSVYVVDDVTTPGIAGGDLLLLGSGSGRTASLVGHARRAKELGATVALITIADASPTGKASPIGECADHVVQVRAWTPKLERADDFRSVQPMGSLFEQTLGLLLDLLVVQLMADLGVTAAEMFARHANLE